MNIKIDIEMTPEELRRFIGLPDVSGIQDDMVQLIRQAVSKGAKGVEAVDLNALREGLQKTKAWQRLMSLVMVAPGDEDGDEDEEPRGRRKTPGGAHKKPAED